jgi:hypothetical protein
MSDDLSTLYLYIYIYISNNKNSKSTTAPSLHCIDGDSFFVSKAYPNSFLYFCYYIE